MVSGGDLARRPDDAGTATADAILGFQLGRGTGPGGARRTAPDLFGGGIRGRMLRLGPAANTILARHGYPEDVSRLLGEALAMTALLADTLKFDGIFTLQARGEGPVSLLVVDYRTPGLLRGHVTLDRDRHDRLQHQPSPTEPVPRLLGGGLLSFTVDQGGAGQGQERPGQGQRYQGIVELAGGTLADCANAYFRQSEQLDTVLRLAAGWVPSATAGEGGGWRVGGILLQRLPGAGADRAEPDVAGQEPEDEDAWPRAMTLLGSARDAELLDPDLGGDALLYRLFHEDGVRVFQPQQVAAHCTCNRDRILRILRTFDPQERAEMIVDARISVTCEFCNSIYHFPPEEVTAAEPD